MPQSTTIEPAHSVICPDGAGGWQVLDTTYSAKGAERSAAEFRKTADPLFQQAVAVPCTITFSPPSAQSAQSAVPDTSH